LKALLVLSFIFQVHENIEFLELPFILFITLFVLSGCGAVETIFKAGMWWALFLAGLVVVIILWIVSKTRK
jgi:hypothetical protein